MQGPTSAPTGDGEHCYTTVACNSSHGMNQHELKTAEYQRLDPKPGNMLIRIACEIAELRATLVWRVRVGPEGAGGTGRAWPRCRRAAAGPGRGAGGRRQGQGGPRDRPLRAVGLACGDLAGGPPPTGTHSGPPHQGRPLGARKSGGARNTRGATSNNTREQTVSGRAAAHRHTQRPGPSRQATRRPEHPWVHKQRRRSGGSASGTATTGGRKAYSPRNALIAGISRTACTRPAR